jgi:parvulin-like peptidyl-prolyl isomerase
MMDRSLAEASPRGAASRRPRSWSGSSLRLASLALAAALAVFGALVPGDPARGQGGAPSGPRAAAGADDPVFARVDGRPIRRSEIELRTERAMTGYRQETGRDVPPAFTSFFQRVALEEAIRERLLGKDGHARGIRVSDAAAESVLRQDDQFKVGGRFDRTRFDAYRRQNPKSFAQVREEARDFLVFQRRARALERELAPDEATLDRMVDLRTESVLLHSALVSEAHYDGRTDPSDEEIRAYYARHRDTFVPPGRVSFTTLTVSGLEEGRTSAPGLARARRQAEALLAEIRAGLPFDSAAARPGVVRGQATWGQGQEHGLFAGSEAWAESAFASPEGRVLPRTFETLDGIALVRIDRGTPRSVPPLSQVAADVRARWRAETVAARERDAARRYYDAHPDSFRTPTWLVRWALVDPARLDVDAPDEDEVRAWFEAHRSEFSRLDPTGGGIRLLTFEEARAEATERAKAERRATEARAWADRLATEWSRGKGGPGARAGVELGGPATIVPGDALPAGLRADLADSARSWERAPRSIVVPDATGFAVIGLVRRNESERPPFEAIEPRVRAAVERERAREERDQARAWFAAHRTRFETGPGYALTYAQSPRPPLSRIDVPRRDIERYYRANLAEFTPGEQVQVRHILFNTRERSVAEATALARQARARIARGESFADVARQVSEDPQSRPTGGDLGWITRGMTVPAFEQAAFALTAKAPISPPVESPYGIHLVQLVDRKGGTAVSFEAARERITAKLVEQYADTLAREQAEELRAAVRSRDELLARADALRLPNALIRWVEGFPLTGPALIDALRADAARVRPGEVLPGVYRYLDVGYVVAALDSVIPSRPLEFEEAEERILAEYRREMRLAAARERAARVERDLAAGRSWREATETVGGSSEPVRYAYGEPLAGIGLLPGLDSLVFGPSPLPANGHGRIETPRGTLLVAVVERKPADAAVRARERESVRRAVLNRRIWEYVEDLRSAARVEILRNELRERPPAPPRM